MKVLFISDKPQECDDLNRIFLGNFPKIELVCFNKGQEALEQIPHTSGLQFTIIDLAHKSDSIITLFHQISDCAKNRPILFMGPKNLINVLVPEDIYSKNFANEVIERPIDIRKFKHAIKTALDWTEEQVFCENTLELDLENFVPMKISNFYRFNKIPFDAYLELGRPKFVRIIQKNEVYSQALIIKYAKSNIKFLYLEKNERLQFLEQSIQQATANFSSKNIPTQNIFEEQIRACSLIHEYILSVGASQSVIDLTGLIIVSIFENFKRFNNLKQILKSFPFLENDSAAKSILIGYVCEAILQKLAWHSDLTRGKLALASILHDITIRNEGLLSITSKDDPNLQDLSEDERKGFLEHPLKAADLAKSYSNFPETSFIIAQHHELPSGKGFPNKLSSHQLTSLSCIFILSTHFVGRLYHGEVNKKTCYSILKDFLENFNDGNFKMPMRVLVTIFK